MLSVNSARPPVGFASRSITFFKTSSVTPRPCPIMYSVTSLDWRRRSTSAIVAWLPWSSPSVNTISALRPVCRPSISTPRRITS